MKKQYKKLSFLLLALFALGSTKGGTAQEWAKNQEEYSALFREELLRQVAHQQATRALMSETHPVLNAFAEGAQIGIALNPILSPIMRTAIQSLIHKYFTKPSLLVDSSPRKDFLGKLAQLFSKAKAPEPIDMALATEESEHPIIKDIKDTKQFAQSGVPGVVQKLYLIYGPPGTGKTLTAEKAAHECGMDFAVITGASLFKFDCPQALAEIDNLFTYAKKNRNGTVIVIDEAESLLLDRNTLAKSSMEYKVLNHLLSYLGTKSPNIVLVMTTNHPELLDQAVKDRVDSFVEMGLPDQALREKVIALYLNKTFLSAQNKNLALMAQAQEFWTPAVIADMAAKTEGLSNRTLQGMVSGLYVAAAQNNGITQELVDGTIEQANKKLALMTTQAANTQAVQ